LGQKQVKRFAKEFPPQTLPGLPRDIKGPVNFHLNYVDGRLQQIGFGLRRDDYAAFVASLTKEHGNPRFVHMVEMDSVKEKQYTWNRARYSIATYAFYPDTAKSAVFYSVIEPIDKQLLKSLGVKPSGDNKQ
jgi:uncharacterized protein YcgL (UPF0745 family)